MATEAAGGRGLRCAAGLMALASALCAAAEPAGKADFAVGDVVAVQPDGTRRPVARGTEILPGDTVDTGGGRAQLRFSDGAVVSLSPKTQFRIDDYRFTAADGQEKGFFSLLKGAMRTVTGLIGRKHRESYRLNTVVATIGIRGTTYSVAYGESITVSTAEGAVEVCNDGGCLVVGAGQSAYVKDAATAPVLTAGGPAMPQIGPGQPAPGYSVGEDREIGGKPAIQLPPPSQSPSCGRYCQ